MRWRGWPIGESFTLISRICVGIHFNIDRCALDMNSSHARNPVVPSTSTCMWTNGFICLLSKLVMARERNKVHCVCKSIFVIKLNQKSISPCPISKEFNQPETKKQATVWFLVVIIIIFVDRRCGFYPIECSKTYKLNLAIKRDLRLQCNQSQYSIRISTWME